MSKNEHKAGEWYVRTYHSTEYDVMEQTNRMIYGVRVSDLVCMLPHGPNNRSKHKANAHLLSAAKEMLAALEICDTFFRANYNKEDLSFWPEIHAAIAKARGES